MQHQRGAERGAHQAGGEPLSGNGAAVPASGHNQGQGSFLRRVSVFGAAGAILIAFFGLLGYVPGLGLLGSIREGYIPMAPSTAISFIVLGGVLLYITLRSLSGASLVLFGAPAALVSLFGTLEVAGHFTGRDLNFEDALVPSAGYLGEIPVARMSPATGAAFLLAGLAVLALVLRQRRTHGRGTRLGNWGGSLGSLVLGSGLLFCLAYIYGSPPLYGQGATVPMALTTALAFLMLGAATVGVSGEEAIPVSLLAGVNGAGKPMNPRRRFLLLALIMVGACAMVMAVITVMLYRRNLEDHSEQLQATTQSQARLIEAMARHDSVHEKNTPGGPTAATLSQIIDAHDRYEGFGETGEFTLARRDGDSIVFVLRHRHDAVERPVPVAFDSDLAEPMRRALEGLSGTVIGLDYRGETVLAAHEPVTVLNLGIVAKIDLSEIRAPFIRSGLTAAAVAFLVVLAGTALFFRVGAPIIERLEAYSRDLEKEVEERKRAEETLRLKEYYLSRAQEIGTIGTWELDIVNNVLIWTDENHRIFGVPIGTPLTYATFLNCVHPDDREYVHQQWTKGMNHEPYDTEHRLLVDGRVKWVREKAEVVFDANGDPIKAIGFTQDITDRKRAQREREELIAKLEAQNAELERFTYTVSHDLKSPLITIKGYVGMLRQDLAAGDSEPVEDDLARISNAADKMDQLLRDLLELSRIGRSANPPDDVSLEELAHEAFEIVGGQVKEKGVHVEISPDLPVIFGDRVRLLEVVQNLIDNAVKYMGDQSQPRVEIGSRRDGYETICFVRDNGIGIDPCHHEKVFGLFDQLDPNVEGSGIGLSLVKRIVEVHGGRVWVESEGSGHGSTFCFTIAERSEST